MEIVKPKVELWRYEGDESSHIAKCARVCYASKNSSINNKFVDNLWKNNHRSMYRHVGVYYIIPEKLQLPHKAFIDCCIKLVGTKYYVSTNRQTALEYFDKYSKYEISYEKAVNNEIFWREKMIRYTFCIETGIDITREFNRKSPNNIAEQSTRYVDFIKKIGIKFKRCHWMDGLSTWKWCLVRLMTKTSELFYKISRSKYGLNLPPEDARWILPLDTMSKVVYTYTVKDWERIINMRVFDWTGKAHKDAKIIGEQILECLQVEGYNISNYNDEEEHIGVPI